MKLFAKLGLIAAGLTLSAVAMADPVGTWRTIDDKTANRSRWCVSALKAVNTWVAFKSY